MNKFSKFNFHLCLFIIIFSCKKPEKSFVDNQQITSKIICTNSQCEGFYKGPEFVNGSDVAHQFSNKMAAKVGEKLKELYQTKNYSMVNFDQIEMSTVGMGFGNVMYALKIPFSAVENKCKAYTSFDHVGGWNHTPALEERKLHLQNALNNGDSLQISSLKSTPENLQEYWIQWKNRDVQKDCF